MNTSIDQQKEILKIDRWAAFSPTGEILESDINLSILDSILKNQSVQIDPDYIHNNICSDFDEDCYSFEDEQHVLLCWLGTPLDLPVSNGFCPIFNYYRFINSIQDQGFEK